MRKWSRKRAAVDDRIQVQVKSLELAQHRIEKGTKDNNKKPNATA